MPLSALNWRYVGNANFVSGIANSHDAIYTLGTSVTYADGSTRTPGSGSAWTWNRQQVTGVTEAVYGTPPINALSFSYIIAGNTTTTAYTFLSPDLAGIANVAVFGMARGAGAYTSWTNAQPFTSGFSGYWRGSRVFATVTFDNVAMWESQEGCIVQYSRNSDGLCCYVAFGALFDPLSSAAADCETDGRRYYMGGSGSTANTVTNFWSSWFGNLTDGGFLQHNTSNQTSHFGTFTPGTTTMTVAYHAEGFQPGNALLTPSGNVVRLPFAVLNTSGNFLGQARQIFVVKDSVTRQTWLDGTTPIGYIVGSTSVGQGDCAVLLY